jgi:hypothetical protein
MVKIFFDQAASLTDVEPGILRTIKESNNIIRTFRATSCFDVFRMLPLPSFV